MSAQHQWLQLRIKHICEWLGYDAVLEHHATRADVYVPARQLAIEVQRWSTAYQERTDARLREGAATLWLLPFQEGDSQDHLSRRALFTLPAARLIVHARGNRQALLTPWLNPDQRSDARLTVFGTVARLNRTRTGLETGNHDFMAFLKDILAGQRRWLPPGSTHLPTEHAGAWVLAEDLAQLERHIPNLRSDPVPQQVVPDTVVPDTVVPDTVVADTVVPDTVIPESLVRGTVVSDILIPESLVPKIVASGGRDPAPAYDGLAPSPAGSSRLRRLLRRLGFIAD